MMKGTIKGFDYWKGFGFVTPADGGKEVFLHISAIRRAEIPLLKEGDKVLFDITTDKRGRDAVKNIELI
jgi:CspA family cold shock protein